VCFADVNFLDLFIHFSSILKVLLLSCEEFPLMFPLPYIFYALNNSCLVQQVQREYHLPPGDFPYVEHFKEVLRGYNFDKFEKVKPKMIQAVDDMLGYNIPELLKNFRNPYE
jgi:hypothetical protein